MVELRSLTLHPIDDGRLIVTFEIEGEDKKRVTSRTDGFGDHDLIRYGEWVGKDVPSELLPEGVEVSD